MYPRWLRNLLLYFDLCGFFTHFKHSCHQPKIYLLILFLHIFLASTATYHIFIYLKGISVDDKLGMLNDVLKYFVLILNYWLSIFESYFKRNTQDKFWKCVTKIDKKLCSHQCFELKNFIIQFKIYSIISILSNVIYFLRLIFRNLLRFRYFWYSYAYLACVLEMRSFYYLFYLEFIKYELKMIDHEIYEMTRVDHKKPMKDFYQNPFKWIRQYYESIYDLGHSTNFLFACSIIVTIILPFHLILVDSNWLYWKILNMYQFNSMGIQYRRSLHSLAENTKSLHFFAEYIAWFVRLGTLSLLIFRAASNCFQLVKTKF